MTRDGTDDGYTLLESLMSISIITTLLAGMTLFFVQVSAVNRNQADAQAATQLAVSSTERVSLLPGRSVLTGRTQAAVLAQTWVPGVSAYLSAGLTELTWQDPSVTDAATALSLPTAAETVAIAGVPSKFSRQWYVGQCWRPVAGGDCVVVPAAQRASRIAMYRVVVAITWPSKDCNSSVCSYVVAMLRSTDTTDPTFGL
jgi:type II secretory pathway pseudopilin PulG